jgi:hypothetical protein
MLPLATTVENRIGDAASRRRCRQIWKLLCSVCWWQMVIGRIHLRCRLNRNGGDKRGSRHRPSGGAPPPLREGRNVDGDWNNNAMHRTWGGRLRVASSRHLDGTRLGLHG